MALQIGVSYLGGDREYVRARRWPFTIGRHPSNDLCLSNSSLISRRHARILKTAGTHRLVACGRNPTYLNGKLVPPDQPVDIHPGDRIELPQYLLEVRESKEADTIAATVNMAMVADGAATIRRVASAVGTTNWSVSAIHDWLQGAREREIRLRHQQIELCLPARISNEQLHARLILFDKLINELDPQELTVELFDPAGNARASISPTR